MTETQGYIDTFMKLTRTGHAGFLAEVLDARLRENRETVSITLGGMKLELRSPAVGFDEPDSNALIFEIYRRLRDKGDPVALETLRRAVVDVLIRGLNRGEGLAYLNLSARLVGYTRVTDSEELATLLRHQLYGFLETHLPRAFDRLMELDGEALDLATLVIDVWLSVIPVQPGWPEHITARVEQLVDYSIEILEERRLALAPRLELLSLAYRAMTKLVPSAAGARFWRVCLVVYESSQGDDALRRRWLATCRHQGMVFSANSEWRRTFSRGVARSPWHRVLVRLELFSFIQRALTKLDDIWGDVAPLIINDAENIQEAVGGFVESAPYPVGNLATAITSAQAHYAETCAVAFRRFTTRLPIPLAA